MTRIDIIRNCFFCKSLFTFKNNEAETRTQCIQNKSNLKCIFNKNLLPYYSKVNLIREVYPKLCIVKNISALFKNSLILPLFLKSVPNLKNISKLFKRFTNSAFIFGSL